MIKNKKNDIFIFNLVFFLNKKNMIEILITAIFGYVCYVTFNMIYDYLKLQIKIEYQSHIINELTNVSREVRKWIHVIDNRPRPPPSHSNKYYPSIIPLLCGIIGQLGGFKTFFDTISEFLFTKSSPPRYSPRETIPVPLPEDNIPPSQSPQSSTSPESTQSPQSPT